MTRASSFLDFLHSTAATILKSFSDVAHQMVEANATDAGENQEPVSLYENFSEAYQALRLNRQHDYNRTAPTIGQKLTEKRRHIAYAFAPIVRKVDGNPIQGRIRLHVLHATKGWKPVIGAGNIIPAGD